MNFYAASVVTLWTTAMGMHHAVRGWGHWSALGGRYCPSIDWSCLCLRSPPRRDADAGFQCRWIARRNSPGVRP